MQIDGIALHVRVIPPASITPARPTLVFLHDSLGCDTVWRDFPDTLAASLGCGAIVYDRRGYGKSAPFAAERRQPDYLAREVPVLERVLDACHVSSAVLFGHSDGGTIALLAAAALPSRVVAVITEGAHVFVEAETLAGIRAAREQLRTTDLRARLQRHHGDNTDAVTAAWIDTWLSPAFRDWRIEAQLPAIRCPTLVLQGERDEFGTCDQVRAIAAGVSGPCETHLMPEAAHTPHREAPSDTMRLVTDFWARHVGS